MSFCSMRVAQALDSIFSGAKKKVMEVPNEYLCPIGHLIMADPVTTVDGLTYERENIEEWLKSHETSPVTNLRLSSKVLTPVVFVRNKIREFLDENPQLIDRDQVYLPKRSLQRFHDAVLQKDEAECSSMLKVDYRVLLEQHFESQMTGLQAICEMGTCGMLNLAIETLRRRNRIEDVQNMGPTPLGWFPRLLLQELPRVIERRDERMMQMIDRLGVRKDTYNVFLLEAARRNEVECVRCLLLLGADVNSVGNEGMTPLIKACCKGHANVAQVLLDFGADVNLADGSGYTPLHWAAEGNYRGLIANLLRHGGDMSARDKSDGGNTPLDLAAQHPNLPQFISALMYQVLAETQQRLARLEAIVSDLRQNGEERMSKKSRH